MTKLLNECAIPTLEKKIVRTKLKKKKYFLGVPYTSHSFDHVSMILAIHIMLKFKENSNGMPSHMLEL